MQILAHETWFTELRPAYDWAFALDIRTLAFVTAALGIAVAWRWLGSRLPTPELAILAPIGRLSPWIPRLLGVHAGVSLLSQAARGTYLAPALQLPDSWLGTLVAIVEGVAGVWLITGWRLRIPATLLIVAGPLGMIGYGVVPILERLDLLGIAAFLVFAPPGADRNGAANPSASELRNAIRSLRFLVGGALIVLAFSEKLARPALALAFLEEFPAFNIMAAMGLNVSDLTFVRIAGGVELLFGLLIISGVLPQLAVIAAGIPFNATLFFLGSSELIGHLPVYGAMLVLVVYGSNREVAPLVSEPPWRLGSRVLRSSVGAKPR